MLPALALLFAVHEGKRRCGVALSLRGVSRHGPRKRGEVRRRQRDIERAERLGETVAPPRAYERDDVVRTCQAGVLAVPDCELAAAQFLDSCKSTTFQPLLLNARERASEERIKHVVATAVRTFLAAYRR